ncbi:beta strand repeat-containing protein [Mangrovicoccus ximenensis]|uniref:beta strand repeat-containing protein n=1 Tax=Mangrovicoccus ximenensis TaxID=1911570 RepID=UPI000D366222|nr:hypothetical protein [Mangrovicoccus ximenensis]
MVLTATSFDDVKLLAIAASASLGSDSSGSEEGGGGSSSSGGGSNVGIAGSVGVAVMTGETKAVLAEGVDVNAQTAPLPAGAGGITVIGSDETNLDQTIGGLSFVLGSGGGITGSVSVSVIDQATWARALGQNVLNARDGGIRFDAHQKTAVNTDPESFTVAVAGVIDTGSSQDNNNSSSIAFAGVGAVVVNVVTNDTQATIGAGSTVNTTGGFVLAAQDESVLVADAGGAALAFTASDGSNAGSFGASVAVNDLTQTIRATATDTPVTAADVSVTAMNDAEIDTLTIAGSFAGGTNGSAFAGAGAGSGNYINATTEARIANPSGTQAVTVTGGGVEILASDNSEITADAGSGALGVSADSSALGAVTAGASAAENKITRATTAALQGAHVSSDGGTGAISGGVTVSAATTSSIDAFTLGIAGSLSTGGDLAFGAAGSGSGNYVTGTVDALINPSTIYAAGAVSVSASDETMIEAIAGSVAVSLNVGSGDGAKVGVGLGVSVTVNEIEVDTEASLTSTTVEAASLDVTASTASVIDSLAFGIALAVTQSSDSAISVAATGAAADNLVANSAIAVIEDTADSGATVTVSGDVTLDASDSTVITADAIAASLSLSISSDSTSVSGDLGVAVTLNDISNTVRAAINDIAVTSTAGAVTLDAATTSSISTTATSASIGISSSSNGTAANFSADISLAFNDIQNVVEAVIEGGAVVTADDEVALTATDDSSVTAVVTAASISAAVSGSGSAGGLSITATNAKNEIDSDLRAVVDGSEVHGASLETTAESNASVDVVATSASIAVTISGSYSLSGTGTGAGAQNSIGGDGGNTITAGLINGASADVDGAVTIQADNNSDIDATVTAASASVSGSSDGSIALTVTVATADNVIATDTSALVENSSVLGGGLLDMDANSSGTIDVTGTAATLSVTASSGNISVGVSVTVAVVQNTVNGSVESVVRNSTVSGTSDVEITAVNDTVIHATSGSVAVGVTVASGSIAFGADLTAAAATNEIGTDTTSGIISSDVTTPGHIDIDVTSSVEATAIAYAASVSVGASGDVSGTIAGAGAGATNTHSGISRAVIEDSPEVLVMGVPEGGVSAGGAVDIDAADTTTLESTVVAATVAVSLGSSASFAIGVSIIVAINDFDAETEAGIFGSTVSGSSIDVTADGNASITATGVAASVSASSGDISFAGAGSGAGADNDLDNRVAALIEDSDATSGSGVTVHAEDSSSITSTVVAAAVGLAISQGGSASIAAAIAVSVSLNEIDTELQAGIIGSNVDAGGAVSVDALNDTTINANAVAVSISAAGGGEIAVGLTGSGSDVDNVLNNTVEATISGSEIVNAGAVTVIADNEAQIDTTAVSASASLTFGNTAAISIAISAVTADLDMQTATSANITDSEITDPGAVTVQAWNDTDIQTDAVAASLSASASSGSFALGVTAAVVATNAVAGGSTEAVIDGSTLTEADSVTVEARDISEIDTTYVSAALTVSASSSVAVGVAIAAGTATTAVTQTVLASISDSVIDSSVNGTADVIVNAQNFEGSDRARVTTLGVSAALSVSASSDFALSGAGAGAEVNVSMDNTIQADVSGGSDLDVRSLSVTATDKAELSTTTVAAAASVAASGTAAVSLTGAVAITTAAYDSSVRAVISASQIDLTGAGLTTISARGDADVVTTSVGAAIAARLRSARLAGKPGDGPLPDWERAARPEATSTGRRPTSAWSLGGFTLHLNLLSDIALRRGSAGHGDSDGIVAAAAGWT